MSDTQEIFNILEDESSAEGRSAIARINNVDLAAAIRGMIGFSFQTHDGKVVLPTLTTDLKVPVSLDSAGIHSEAHGTVTPGGAGVRTLVVTATLTVDKLYKLDFLSGASTQTVLWEVEQVDDATNTVRHKFITGSGQFTDQMSAGCWEFDAGASGTQEVRLYGTQVKNNASDMNGTICLLQIGA